VNSELDKIQNYIDSIWIEAGAWSEYIQTMRFALKNSQAEHSLGMLSLPGLCCKAAGGKPDQAYPIAIAWYLFYRAAAIIDSVEDQDEPDQWWQKSGSGVAISAATGLYFTACQTLNRLDSLLDDRVAAGEIRSQMLNRFIRMGSGQHFDLTHSQISLDEYSKIAAAKSGAFFEMACWAGARVSTGNQEVLSALEHFGMQVGLTVQILDDLKEFTNLEQRLRQKMPTSLWRSLPIVYVLDVASEETRTKLVKRLSEVYSCPESANEIIEIIEQNGGVFYMDAELGKIRILAEKTLEKAEIPTDSRRELLTFFEAMHAAD
jgi:geranylgeranyl pyrophosphate synthase